MGFIFRNYFLSGAIFILISISGVFLTVNSLPEIKKLLPSEANNTSDVKSESNTVNSRFSTTIPSPFLESLQSTQSGTILSRVSESTIAPTPTSKSSSSSTGNAASSYDPCGSLKNGSYDQLVLDDSPVAYFPFNEENIVCDHGRNHYYAQMGGGEILPANLPNGDRALEFDSGGDYITVADADGLSVATTGILTIEAWMRPNVLQFHHQEGSGYVHWLGKGETNAMEYVLRMYSETNDESRPNRVSGYAFNSTGGLGVGSYFQDSEDIGDWIHVVLVINTQNTSSSYPTGYTKIFKNGAQRDKDSLSSLSIVPTNGSAPLRIGTRDLASFFQGAIGKVAIYNYELTAYQVLEHYQRIVPPVVGSATHIQSVGTVSTETAGTSMQVTVSNTVSNGNTLIVRVLTDYSASAPTVSDSKGNTYTRDRTAPNSGNTIRAAIYSAPVTTSLVPGDTITITSASVTDRAAAVDEFSGLAASSILDQSNGTSGNSTTPGTTISITTTQDDELIIGFAAIEGPLEDTFTEDTLGQFSSLTRVGTTDGDDDTNITINGGYKSVGTTGTYQYQPTLDPARKWILFLASYKAL